MLSDAANTIESLSAKLADMEQTDRKLVLKNTYYVKRKRKDDVIVSIMYNRADNKYHFVNLLKTHICSCGFETIEEAIADMEQRKNNGSICDFYLIERSAEDCGGGWIKCKDRLPTKKECGDYRGNFIVTVYTNKLTTLYMDYEYAIVRGKEVGRWIWNDRVNIPWEVIAWQPLPEPYHEP